MCVCERERENVCVCVHDCVLVGVCAVHYVVLLGQKMLQDAKSFESKSILHNFYYNNYYRMLCVCVCVCVCVRACVCVCCVCV